MATKRTKAKKVEPLSMFTGPKQNHLRTGAKYSVMSLSRTHSNNKGAAASNARGQQFNTKRDADAWAKSQSRKNEDRAYVVIGTKGYDRDLKEYPRQG